MTSIDAIISSLNNVKWYTTDAIPEDVIKLVDEHSRRLVPVLARIRSKTKDLTLSEAHTDALAPASDSSTYGELVDRLFAEWDYTFAGIREPIILLVAAESCWSLDSDLGELLNPWTPLLSILNLGFPITFDDSEDGKELAIKIGTKMGAMRYIVATE